MRIILPHKIIQAKWVRVRINRNSTAWISDLEKGKVTSVADAWRIRILKLFPQIRVDFFYEDSYTRFMVEADIPGSDESECNLVSSIISETILKELEGVVAGVGSAKGAA